MRKPEYLAQAHVRPFIDYLRTYVAGRPLPHGFTFLKTGRPWACDSLPDALQKYEWPIRKQFSPHASGSDFDANKQVLDSLARDLRAALSADDSAGLAAAAIRVMQWGGTEKGNNDVLRRQGRDGTAVAYFREAARTFGPAALDASAIGSDRIRSNAGFTKIYALLRDDFVIYDSRVAAALALLVIAYCREAGLAQVPAGLAFQLMPAKESPTNRHRKLRHPAFGTLTFTGVHGRHLAHARSNARANWLLTEALDGARFHAATPGEDLRALEAALFMVGYDLTASPLLAA